MNYGPLVFLAALFALATSWFGFVLTPQMQVGHLHQTNTVPVGAAYPVARPGLARQGLDVYRANGCAYCHSQQVGQTGTVCDVLLTEAGTNQPLLLTALRQVKPSWSDAEAKEALTGLPATIVVSTTPEQADADVKTLSVGGAKAQIWVRPEGPDIARGWGKRRTVAEDFLFDDPVMLGSQRVGPDLANVGVRWPDAKWQFRHLYSPQTEVQGSMMPSYRYLFEKRLVKGSPTKDAISVMGDYEIVPKQEGQALVAYLLGLRADSPLFVAPLSVANAPAATGTETNAPAGTNASSTIGTNAPAGNK